MKRILLLTPPMVQINTPYPATAYLKGFLKKYTPHEIHQADLGLELALKLFSLEGLARVKDALKKNKKPEALFFQENFSAYQKVIEPLVAFLQGKNPKYAKIFLQTEFPQGPRFAPLHEYEQIQKTFQSLNQEEQAKHLGALLLDELADIFACIDPDFSFSRYGERLAASQADFSPLHQKLQQKNLLRQMLDEICQSLQQEYKPDIVALSAPFSGTVLGALSVGAFFRAQQIPVLLGGGYPNTELRSLKDPRVFSYVDFITLDDGEKPFLLLLEHLEGNLEREKLLRTYALEKGAVRWYSDPKAHDIPFRDTPAPDYTGLKLDSYISMLEMLNPVNRLWTEEKWNKITLAHGCYWKKCSFCDTSLDYIQRYESSPADLILEKMIQVQKQTGWDGFHFVDEAAPPAILKSLSEKIIARGLTFRWWGNIRFDKNFTRELTDLMAKAGCIAVTGGLEVASPRILSLIQKGVTVEQVAKVAHNFSQSGILVHSYLMYGFPTQSVQETVDSLEVVRQLFQENCLKSAFWHRFAATVHSPVGKNPSQFGITLLPQTINFAQNDIAFHDPSGIDHDTLGLALKKALYNYMHGQFLDRKAHEWFEEYLELVPKTQISATLIRNSL